MTKFTHFGRWRTKLVKSFDEGLNPNFAQTWGTKNIFNPIFYDRLKWVYYCLNTEMLLVEISNKCVLMNTIVTNENY